MLTKEDLKKIEELLQPKFDHIELRLDEHDKRFEAIDKKLVEIENRVNIISDMVATHTVILKEMNLGALSEQGNIHRLDSSIKDLWTNHALHSEKIKNLENKTGTYNMLLDKSKDSYTKALK